MISFLKAHCMVEKECLGYLAFIQDSSTKVPTMNSIPVVREFPEVFHTDLPVCH